MSSDLILSTRDLGKRFGKRWAVRHVNLEVRHGDIFGFLGPNGAGKSTSIRMMLSLIRPTEGEVFLFGRSLHRDRALALARVGGLVERPDFYPYLTAIRNLMSVAALTGGVPRGRIDEVLELVGLSDRGRDTVKTYSHGMKQRLGIAQALLTDPELVVLDEPTNGLDPHGMKEVRELILRLAREHGKTIILSSHLLHEVELVANRMAIINRGELVVQGDVHTLLKQDEGDLIVDAGPVRAVQAAFRRMRTVIRKVTREDATFRVQLPQAAIPNLVRALVAAGARVRAVQPRRSLEDYFLSITESAEAG